MKEKKNNWFLYIMIAVMALVLIAVVVVAVRKNMQENPKPSDSENSEDYGESNQWQENVIKYNGTYYRFNDKLKTYLILGIDRDGTVEDENAEGVTDGGQSDAMFLLVTDAEHETMSLISIHRNSMTEIKTYEAGNSALGSDAVIAQICTQHGFGDGGKVSCSRTVDAVSNMFYDLPINGYLSLNMGAIPIMNDAIGGTEVTVLQDLSYPDAGVELKKGEKKTLMGLEAYYYLRGRDINEYDSATYRLRRQEQYITSYFSKLKTVAGGSPSKLLSIYQSIEDYVVTNLNFVDLMTDLMEYEYNDDRLYTVPGETVMGEKFEEYHIDEDGMYELIVNVFYKPVEEKQ